MAVVEAADDDPRAVEQAWTQEIERRIAARDAGRARSLPFEATLAAISAQLAAARAVTKP